MKSFSKVVSFKQELILAISEQTKLIPFLSNQEFRKRKNGQAMVGNRTKWKLPRHHNIVLHQQGNMSMSQWPLDNWTTANRNRISKRQKNGHEQCNQGTNIDVRITTKGNSTETMPMTDGGNNWSGFKNCSTTLSKHPQRCTIRDGWVSNFIQYR